jgi:hypothetical protein
MKEENNNQKPKQDAGKISSTAPASPSGGDAGGATGIRKIISGIKAAVASWKGKADESGAQAGDFSANPAHQRIVLRGPTNRLLCKKLIKERNHE